MPGLGSACRDVGGDLVFGEPLEPLEPLKGTPHLVVAGAGHAGVAVAQLGVLLGFRAIVVDERPEFADPGRLPGVAEVICGDNGTTLAVLPSCRPAVLPPCRPAATPTTSWSRRATAWTASPPPPASRVRPSMSA